MNKIFSLAVLTALLAIPALAADDNAQVLVDLKVERVEVNGKVLKRNQMVRSERILVGVPVEVTLPNACTKFVGQDIRILRIGALRLVSVIRAKGVMDPMADVCTAVAPSPIRTSMIVEFNVKGEARDRDSAQTLWVRIGSHMYRVTLNAGRDGVEISRILR